MYRNTIDRLLNRKLTVKRRAFLRRIIYDRACTLDEIIKVQQRINYRFYIVFQVLNKFNAHCRSVVHQLINLKFLKQIELVDFRSCVWAICIFNGMDVLCVTITLCQLVNSEGPLCLNHIFKYFYQTHYYIWDTSQFLLFFLSINGRVFARAIKPHFLWEYLTDITAMTS